MLKKLSVNNAYLLIGGIALVLFISYQLAIKNTIAAWQINKQLTGQIANENNTSVQPDYLARKSSNLAKIINQYKTDTIAFRSNVINTIASVAEKEGVKLSEVPAQDPWYRSDRFIIQKLSFEGDYFALIKTLDGLQKTTGIGMVRSVGLQTVITRSNTANLKKLVMEVYMEMVVE